MAASIKEQCIQDLVSALRGIKQSAGYAVTIQSVQRVLPAPDTAQSVAYLPALYLTEGEEEITHEPNGCSTKTLIVGLDIKTTPEQHPSFASLASACNAIEADIERAVCLDTQRGGNAIDTLYVGREEVRQDEDSAEFRMRFLMRYRHRFGNPYEAV